MNSKIILSVMPLFLVATSVAHCQLILGPTEDSTISRHPNVGNGSADGVHGNLETLAVVLNQSTFLSCPIMRFDLSDFAGQIVLDNFVEITLSVALTHPNYFTHRFIGVHRVLVDWDEQTTTWNNFGPTPGPNSGVDYEDIPIFVIPDIFEASTGTSVSIILPGSLVQSWIDQPETNKGIILVTRETFSQSDVSFWSKESVQGTPPQITLSLEPRIGDVNCDGAVDLLDVAPFVDIISSGSFNDKADVNRDGVVNLLDVAPFVNLLAVP